LLPASTVKNKRNSRKFKEELARVSSAEQTTNTYKLFMKETDYSYYHYYYKFLWIVKNQTVEIVGAERTNLPLDAAVAKKSL
jgi:hypothetical protein